MRIILSHQRPEFAAAAPSDDERLASRTGCPCAGSWLPARPSGGSVRAYGPGERRRMDAGTDRVAARIGEADPGDQSLPGPHRLLEQRGIHVYEPELGTAKQPQRPVTGHVAPGQAEAAVVAGARDERPAEVKAIVVAAHGDRD